MDDPHERRTKVASPETSPSRFTVNAPDVVVYDAPRDQYFQIWSVGASGGEPRPLTSGKALSLNPWAASGVIVFDRLDSTGIHIWRMGADGNDLRQLTSGAGEQVGALSRDGRFVSFTPYDAQQTVSVLSVEDGQVFPVATETGATVGFSPDGRLLLVSRIEPDARGLIRDVWTAFPVQGGDPVASFRLPGTAVDPGWPRTATG